MLLLHGDNFQTSPCNFSVVYDNNIIKRCQILIIGSLLLLVFNQTTVYRTKLIDDYLLEFFYKL